jgi:hypothetical protein
MKFHQIIERCQVRIYPVFITFSLSLSTLLVSSSQANKHTSQEVANSRLPIFITVFCGRAKTKTEAVMTTTFWVLVLCLVCGWAKATDDCSGIVSCEGIAGHASCGWCPSLGVAKVGSSVGPADGNCPATAAAGQWTWHTRNCACLNATRCTHIANTDCGWCPSQVGPGGVGTGHAYLGSSAGPFDGIPCIPNAKLGQWTWHTRNCACLNATRCTHIANTDCGWCPSQVGPGGVGMGHAYLGSSSGPYDQIPCIPSESLGQWTWNLRNCKCLDCTQCLDIANTDCGWCGANRHCYQGSSAGPYGLRCAAGWVWYTRDCSGNPLDS